MQVDLAEMRKRWMSVSALATFGVAASIGIVGTGLWLIARSLGLPLPLVWALVFGALISPTDPVAVLATVRQVKLSKSLQVILQGEALYNDGVGIVAFTALLALATGAGDISPARVVSDVVVEALGGLFFGMPLYAHLFLLRNGLVFFSGGRMDDPNPQGPVLMDLTTNPVTMTFVPGLEDATTRDQSASVLLPPAQDQRAMILGGGPGDASNATGSTAIVDLTAANPAYAPAAEMGLPRMHLNAVLLPDHTVFVSGGALSRENHLGARLQSEIYDPATDTWKVGAIASVVRMYHSIALLLPDGRVISAGGNPPPYGNKVPWEPPNENEEMRLEVYSPPYLFAGPRPVISAAPTEWKYGQDIVIGSPQAGNIKWASIIRPGVTTHSFDNSQRLVDLAISAQAGGQVHAASPAQATLAPPGWYMLFLIDNTGVPSVATWIHLSA